MQSEKGMNQQTPLILIYYKFRGQLQPIRNLLCYLNIPFIEVHPEYLREEKRKLPPSILHHLRKFKIDQSQLPAMIHGDNYAWGQLVICDYICRKFNKLELYGTDIRTRAKVREILEIYVIKHAQSMIKMLETVDLATEISDQEFNEAVKSNYEDIFDNSKYARAICQYLDMQSNPAYIFGEITLMDFFFMESCLYSIGMADSPKRLDMQALQEYQPSVTPFLQKPNPYYMSVMKSYVQRVRGSPWYRQHKDYLQSFSIVSIMITEKRARGLRKAWLGDPKFVV